jgi:hypothetical protein
MSESRKQLLRQGDVLLVPVAQLPEAAVEVASEQGTIVLAEGEATGHAHVVPSCGARLLRWQERPATRALGGGGTAVATFLHVDGTAPVAVTHEEHDPIPLEPGVYEVRRQREYLRRATTGWVRD